MDKRDKTVWGGGNILASDMVRYDIKEQLSSDVESDRRRYGRFGAIDEMRQIKSLEICGCAVPSELPTSIIRVGRSTTLATGDSSRW